MKRKNFEIIREGLARARFCGQFSGAVIPGETVPVTLAAVENNGGLDPAEYFVTLARLLSAATTPYRKFDFSRDGVLKAAVPLFDGLTLYANHDADVTQWKGRIQQPVWDDQNAPNGINAQVVFDRTVDPNLARGVETKALRSFSVTIWFSYERSHPDLAGFWDRLGEEVDGEIVRLIVTEITNAGEVSVVWEGEDPYAKSFETGTGDGEPGTGEQHTNTGGNTEMKLNAATMTLLGIATGTEMTEALLEEKIGEKVNALNAKVAELEPDATLGKQLLTETRTAAVTAYKALKGEKVQQDFIDGVIEKADLKTARALYNEFQADLDRSVPLKCTKCGEPVSRRSSHQSGDHDHKGNKNPGDYKL